MPQDDVDTDALYAELTGRKRVPMRDDTGADWERAVAEGWNPEPGFMTRPQAE